jgi:O-antigen ligase
MLERLSLFFAMAYGAVAVGGDFLAWRAVETGKAAGAALVVLSGARALRASWERRAEGGSGPERARPPRSVMLWAALLLWSAASLLWTVDSSMTTRVCKHLAQEGVLLLALSVCPGRRALLRALGLGALLGAAVLALGFLWAAASRGVVGGRLHLWGGDANYQARALLAGALMGGVPWAATVGGGRRAVLLLAGSGSMGLALGLSGSRGAWLAALAAALVVSARPPLPSRGPARRWLVPFLLSAALGAALLSAVPGARAPLPGLRQPAPPIADSDRGRTERMTSGRSVIWRNVLELVAERPVLGVGAGAVPAVYDAAHARVSAPLGLPSQGRRDAHNQYLQLLAELGPLGLLLFLFGLGAVVGDLRRAAARPAGDEPSTELLPRLAAARLAAPALAAAAAGALTVSVWEQKAAWLLLGWAALQAAPGRAPAASSRIVERNGPSAASSE